jgi:hypothetical protein
MYNIHVHVDMYNMYMVWTGNMYMLYVHGVVVDMCMYRAVHMRHRDTCDT